MNNLSAIFCVGFPQVQFIDLREQVVKAAVIVDCKTVRIFAFSSTGEQSNKTSGTRLKT